MQTLTVILGVLAAGLHGTAYVFYNRQTWRGTSHPNAASWSVWAFLSILNAASYRSMSGDTVTSLQFLTGSVACLLTFLITLVTGRFTALSRIEWRVLTMGIIAAGVWRVFQSATGANMIILVTFVVSFMPTLVGVWRDHRKETPRSWILWTTAFAVTCINVVLRERGITTFITPFVMLLLHGGVAVLARKEKS